MPRHCTICAHAERLAIEDALHQQMALRTIAHRWSVSKTSLLRHREAHRRTTPEAPQRPHAAAAVSPEPPDAPASLPRLQTRERTAAEDRELLTLLVQYSEGAARFKQLQAVRAEDWPQLFSRPQAEVLANLQRGQDILAERLRAEGVF